MNEDEPTNLWKEISAERDGSDGYTALTKSGTSVLMGKNIDGQPVKLSEE